MIEVTNKTSEKQTFQFEIDQRFADYPVTYSEMFTNFYQSDLPFKLDAKKQAVNSEHKHKCFFIENPSNKTMEK